MYNIAIVLYSTRLSNFQSVYVVIAFQFFGKAYSEFHQRIWWKEKTFNIRILGKLGYVLIHGLCKSMSCDNPGGLPLVSKKKVADLPKGPSPLYHLHAH